MSFSNRIGWIGVDVGTHTVKVAQAVRTAEGLRLHRAAIIQRTDDWSGSDALAHDQPSSSQSEIYAALECGGFAGHDAGCLPPMNVCQLRGLHVPPGDERERRTMIVDELSEEWAGQGSQMEFDYWELEAGKTEKGADGFNVSVLATARPWVMQLARDCRRSGLDCWAIDGLPLAMARAVSLVGGAVGGRRVLAVDWGYSNATLCVVGDGRPLYARRIQDCGFGQVLDTIVRNLGVTLDEAQHLVDTQGVTAPAGSEEVAVAGDAATQTAITSAAEATIEKLVGQIGRTLQFMESQRRHLHPVSIWLLGGGASMANIAPHLGAELPLPVHIWQLPPHEEPIPCAAGSRSAVFGGAVALSALAWGTAA